MQRTEEVLPFIYTPTVGEACERYHELPLQPYGVCISLEDRGNVSQRLRSLGRLSYPLVPPGPFECPPYD
jgi:malate dehydrogenase (oxaloacetate-decarboxylating)(NADP+)